MPDGFAQLRKGEKRPIYGQETAASGTLTVSSVPQPSVTLFDAGGVAMAGWSALAATGYDSGAQAAPRVWYNLDTATLAPGFYTAVFTFTAAGSDGVTRVYRPSVEVQVARETA